MKKQSTASQSGPARLPARENLRSSLGEGGFLGPRLLLAVLVCAGIGCLVMAGTLPATAVKFASLHSEAPANPSHRTLTFAERVSYQRAIENVYWPHRIWPRSRGENPDPKPSLDAVM